MYSRLKKLIADRKHEERGAIAVMLALGMTVFLTFAAVVVDVGMAYVEAAKAQKAVDVATMAAGSLLPISASSDSERLTIENKVSEYMGKNGYTDASIYTIELGNIINGKYTSVDVNINTSVETGFARIFGVDQIEVNRDAMAAILTVSAATGVVPISVEETALNDLLSSGQTEHVVLKYGNKTEAVVNGAFGALEIDGELGGGANDYEYYLSYGYDDYISVGDQLPVKTGNMTGPTNSGIDYRYYACNHFASDGGCTAEHYVDGCSRLVTVPVVRYTDKHDIEVVSFAVFIIEDVTTYSSKGYVVGTFLETNVPNGYGDVDSAVSDYGAHTLCLIK